MISIKKHIYDAISNTQDIVQDTYPQDWSKLPIVQYTEEENRVYEWCDGSEQKSYICYRIDFFSKEDITDSVMKVDQDIAELGMIRISCKDVSDESNHRHKILRYEGVIEKQYNGDIVFYQIEKRKGE